MLEDQPMVEMRLRARRAFRCLTALLLVAWLAAPAAAEEPTPQGAAADASEQEPSLTEINKKLTNPVSDLWSITFQQNNYRVDVGPGIGERWNSNLNFQPVLPVALNDEWNLITRPVMTLVNSVPHPDPGSFPLDDERTTTFGDIVALELLSPSAKLVGGWLLGVGPTFIFPTAGSRWTGQGKWQVGPSAVAGYLSEKWIAGLFVQQWFSFAGSSCRSGVSQMNLQPFASYFLPDGWSVAYSGNVLANWKETGDEVWTLPIGVAVAKVLKLGKLPVRISLGGQYMPIRPDVFGQKWNIQVIVAPVLPKLIRGNLLEPDSLAFGLGK
jgi:hypothetical protein